MIRTQMVVVLVNFLTANTCKVNSPFISSSSSSEEEEAVQREPDRGRKGPCRALAKHANTGFELGWKEKIQTVQKPALYGVSIINKNFHITQYSSPWDMFDIFFSPEMFKLIQKETNRYAGQQINKKKQEGPLKPKPVCAQCNSLITRNKKIIFDNHAYKRVTQVISVELLEFASDYLYPIHSFCWNVSGYVLRVIDNVLSE